MNIPTSQTCKTADILKKNQTSIEDGDTSNINENIYILNAFFSPEYESLSTTVNKMYLNLITWFICNCHPWKGPGRS
jgi:hypothetical protein